MRPAERLQQARAALAAGTALRTPAGAVLDTLLATESDPETLRDQLQTLVNNSPQLPAAKLLFSFAQDAAGEHEVALETLRAAVPDGLAQDYDCLSLAADALTDWGAPEDAIHACSLALAIAPHASHALLRRGRAFAAAGDVTGAVEDLRHAIALQPDLLDAHLALAAALQGIGRQSEAATSFRHALALEPANEAAQRGLDAALVALVPPWHAAMLNDTVRTEAFRQAIERAVTPGLHVLDIGSGTGLLAMMAARAGAARVSACETIGSLADTANDIIKNNGFSDKINLFSKLSDDLSEAEMGSRADLLVAEILDAGLLSEGVLHSFADARARLLKPDAKVIPQAGTIHAVPIECPALYAERRVGMAAGFDLSPFNALTPKLYLQADLRHYDWRALAAPAPVFHFDFRSATPDPAETVIPVTAAADGTAQLIAFWFTLALDEKTALSTAPDAPPTHWQQAVYALSSPLPVKLGQEMRILAGHDGNAIRLALEMEEAR